MSSGGDIRKAILQLQFWFQSNSKRGILDVFYYMREKYSPRDSLVKD